MVFAPGAGGTCRGIEGYGNESEMGHVWRWKCVIP